jgi:hypothetical protein
MISGACSMIVVVSLYFSTFILFSLPFFLYRHGVDDYPFLSGLFSASHLGKLNWWIRFNLAVGPRWAAKQGSTA